MDCLGGQSHPWWVGGWGRDAATSRGWGPLRTEHDGHRGCQPRSGGDPGNKATSEVEHGPGEWPESDRAQSRNPRCRSALVVQ